MGCISSSYHSITLKSSQDVTTYVSVCPQVKVAYVNFLNHCYVDTEVEMKEIYTSNHMWKLFDDFLVDICRVRNKSKFVAHIYDLIDNNNPFLFL